MPRNGSGTMSTLTSFVNGETADAEFVMNDLNDIAAEISNSVAADGQTTLTGPIKLPTGSVSSPALQWGADSNTGLYRKGGDNIGVACGGADVMDIGTGGVDFTGDIDISGALTLGTALAVAEGGTGATTASAAATALGLGTGDSPQFTAVNIGAATDTTITRVSAGVIAVEGATLLTTGAAATQAQQESASSTTTFVSPGRQQFHPAAAKAWALVGNSGSATLQAGYNVASVTDNGTGDVTVTFTDAMQNANYVVSLCLVTDISGALPLSAAVYTKATGSFGVRTGQATAAGNCTITLADAGFMAIVFGDLP